MSEGTSSLKQRRELVRTAAATQIDTMPQWGQHVRLTKLPGHKGRPQVEGGDVVRQAGEADGRVEFLGRKVLDSGQDKVCFKIVESEHNDGFGMFMGYTLQTPTNWHGTAVPMRPYRPHQPLVEAPREASVAAEVSYCGRVVAWGFSPLTGYLYAFTDPLGYGSETSDVLWRSGLNLLGEARGMTVEMTVSRCVACDQDSEMVQDESSKEDKNDASIDHISSCVPPLCNRRKMLVSVNGSEPKDVGIELPAAVRLWCRLFRAGDAVQLVEAKAEEGK